MAESLMLHNYLIAIPIRLRRGEETSIACPKMTPVVASGKKGGRLKASLADPELVSLLREAIREQTAGSPADPNVIWTNRSPAELADELTAKKHPVDRKTVKRLLKEELGLSLRQMVKTLAMGQSADRDAQFRRLQKLKAEFFSKGWPVLSIDTKKKELLGNFYRRGPAWTNGQVRAWDHDFPSSSWGKVIPYGVYDMARNESLVYLAQGSDTGQLAVDAIRRWWFRMGKWYYPPDTPILLLADCGGSNGYRVSLFREQLQDLSNRLHRTIRVSHLPPYCSKYNPIDHRLFCHISRSLQSVMIKSVELIRDAIQRTTTRPGLRVVTELARTVYQSGIKASARHLQDEPVIRDRQLPKFNYRFEPT